jgi:hypothetical protein
VSFRFVHAGFDPTWAEALASLGFTPLCMCHPVPSRLTYCRLSPGWPVVQGDAARVFGANAWFSTEYDSKSDGLMRLAGHAPSLLTATCEGRVGKYKATCVLGPRQVRGLVAKLHASFHFGCIGFDCIDCHLLPRTSVFRLMSGSVLLYLVFWWCRSLSICIHQLCAAGC